MKSMLLVILLLSTGRADAQGLSDVLSFIDTQWSTERFKSSLDTVRGFPIALGKMKKISGTWQPEVFEPVTGELLRETWQVTDVSVVGLFDETVEMLSTFAELRYFCASRECGNASEWASRVYQQRLLYGRDEFLRFAAFQTPQGRWVTVFSAARSADRQYLHIDSINPEQ